MAESIRDLIQKIAKPNMPLPSIPCKVLSIDEDSVTCDVEPLNGDAEILGVKLSANEDSDTGVIIYPKEESIVYVIWLDSQNALVTLVSEVDKVTINTNELSLVIDDETIALNGDEFGGIVDAKELKKQCDKNSGAIDSILDAINNGIPVPQDGGSGLQASMKAFIATAESGDFSSIENEKVTHGG